MAAPQKVSFTVRRPTPVSRAASSGPDSDNPSFKVPSLPRHLAQSAETTPLGSPLSRSEVDSPYTNGYDDSSDEDDVAQDELVTGFDRFGVQRLHEDNKRKKKQEPLVIPALKNKDWRELARKRRSAQQYVPISAKASTGADGSVGGLGTRDLIGAEPVLSGLQLGKKVVKVESEDGTVVQEEVEDVMMEKAEFSEDELARRAILAEAGGLKSEGDMIDAIPTPVSEGDAYKQDVQELPDVSSLEDYTRVPVEQFGAAMLRGMGWKEGTAASKNGKGMVQPYLPAARPALLGIGAKEMEVFDDGSKKKKGPFRSERKYVPLIKKERERGDTPRRERSRSPHRSRRSSPSMSENKNHSERRRGDDYSRKLDHDQQQYKERENRERNKSREQDRNRERGRGKDEYREKQRDRDRYERNGDRWDEERRDHDRDDRGDRLRESSRRRDY